MLHKSISSVSWGPSVMVLKSEASSLGCFESLHFPTRQAQTLPVSPSVQLSVHALVPAKSWRRSEQLFFYRLCHSTDSFCPTSALQPYHKHLGGLMSSINNCLQNSPTFIVVNDWVAPHWDCRKGLIQTSYSPICPIWGCKIRNMFFGNNKGNHNERAKCVRSEHLFILISRGLTKAKANFCICKTLKLC